MKARRIRVGLQLGRHIGKLSRDLQVVDDRSEVEAGAADEDRHRSSLTDAIDRVRASDWNSLTVKAWDGSTRSMRWCRTRACSAAVGVAVPTFIPR